MVINDQEWQVKVTGRQRPREWPDSQVRDRVLKLIGRECLLPLFDLQQTRVIRTVQQEKQPVAELSLDSITVTTTGGEHIYRELELELLPAAPQEILAAITACLQDEWGLRAESRSKFERALELLDSVPASDAVDWTPPQRSTGLAPAHELA